MTLAEWYDNNEQNILDNISSKIKYNVLDSKCLEQLAIHEHKLV